MITPDAKCVVNGAKVNEAIMALNPLLSMSVGYIGGGKPPQVTYTDGEVKILLPLADSVEGFLLEELDVVDSNNAASSRYFMTSSSSVSTYGTTTATTSGTPTGKQSSPQPTKGRNKLNAGGNNRDQLGMAGAAPANQGGAVAQPNIVAAAAPGLQAAPGGGGGGGGSANMISIGGRQTSQQPTTETTASTTSSPPAALTPDAPPQSQPTTVTQDDAAPVTQDDAVAKRWANYLQSKEDLVYSLSRQLSKAKKNDTQRWDASKNRWLFKKFGDPDSDLVQSLENRLKTAKEQLKLAQARS